MPHRVGKKWKWGNIERRSKEDLRKTVYGIWMKNGSKGSFSKFWKTGKVNEGEGSVLYRFCYDGIGIYEAAKRKIFETYGKHSGKSRWMDIVSASSWLPKPSVKYSSHESWFTKEGKDLFIKLVFPLLAQYLDKDSIQVIEKPDDAVEAEYRDRFQVVELSEVQEKKASSSKFLKTGKANVNNTVDMIEQLFDEAVHDYTSFLGIDLSYMKYKISTQPVYNNGKPCFEYKPEECAGDWTKLGWIRLNPDIASVRQHYAVDDMTDIDFMRAIIRHELAHEIWHMKGNESLKKQVLEAAKEEDFTTKYLKTVEKHKFPEETFCEYLAANLDDMPNQLQSKLVFKKVPRDKLTSLLDEIETYNESKRFKREQFEKYLGSDKMIDREDKSMYYGLFSLDGHCLALSYLNKTPDECILVAQISCVVPSYGRLLLQDIINRSSAMWLAADPTASKSLLDYYRTFNLEEVALAHSKWADGKEEHFFLKADGENRQKIIDKIQDASSAG